MLQKFKNYLKIIGKSPNTTRSYVSALENCIKKGIINEELSTINTNKLLVYKASPITKHLWIASIKKYAQFLLKQGKIKQLPKELSYIEVPPIRRKLKSVISQEKLKKLLSLNINNEISTILHILITTGCRIDTLSHIKIEHITEHGIEFHNTKGDSPYIGILTEDTQKIIKKYIKQRKSGYLFLRKNGKRRTSGAIRILLHRKLKKEYINPHKLRRSIATALLENGASLYDVKEFLNHSNINTTLHYVNLTAKLKKERLKNFHPML